MLGTRSTREERREVGSTRGLDGLGTQRRSPSTGGSSHDTSCAATDGERSVTVVGSSEGCGHLHAKYFMVSRNRRESLCAAFLFFFRLTTNSS